MNLMPSFIPLFQKILRFVVVVVAVVGFCLLLTLVMLLLWLSFSPKLSRKCTFQPRDKSF